MSGAPSPLLERLAVVRGEVAEAARQAGRDPASVRLLAVSKLQPIEAVAAALAAGQTAFGENYAQELRDKARALPGMRWHFLGPLQRNKVKYVVGVARLIHSVDGPSLLEEIARRAEVMGTTQRCLIEVNVGDEQQKAGCLPDDLPQLLDAARALPEIALEGLMCIPPPGDAEATRPFFRRLRELRDAERARTGLPLPELSMGMSADFAAAIAEGATLVRVGTAIFGPRPQRP